MPTDTTHRTTPPLGKGTGSPFDGLNDEQRAVVSHGLEPLLVVAGAGSGKTLALAARVARLMLDGADPQRLLMLTFSRRAAAEMARRAGRLLHEAMGLRSSAPTPELPWCGTFHGIGARLLHEHARAIGLPADSTVIDRPDAQELMAWVRTRLGLHQSERRFPLAPTCLAIASRTINSQAALADVLQQHFPWCAEWHDALQQLFGAYVEAKQQQHLLDYDDLLLYWHHMMGHADLARRIGARFDHVLVDEFQDTNRLQGDILLALKPDGRGLTVVGDDAQSIYAFRDADVQQMLAFPQRFEPAAKLLMLERNYRSTQAILDASNAIIGLASQRFAKRMWTERESACKPQLVAVEDEAAQAAWVATQVLVQREEGLALKRQAVLFRASHHSAALELELTRRRIPFVKFGGLRFLEAAHVKDTLSVLRWAQNPRCRLAGFRVARLVPGIGPAAAQRLLDRMASTADPADALLSWLPPPRAVVEWSALRETWRSLHGNGLGWPEDITAAVAWLAPLLPRQYDDARVRQADLDQLCRIATGFPSRERFLTELALDPPDATSDESGPPGLDEDYLILSTIHSAKGQEWNAVHVLNVVDGCMPSDLATGNAEQIEEERRLLYVAMTRARDHLHLLVPQRFHVTQQRAFGSRHLYASRSRFIPQALDGLFDAVLPATASETSWVNLPARRRARRRCREGLGRRVCGRSRHARSRAARLLPGCGWRACDRNRGLVRLGRCRAPSRWRGASCRPDR